MNQRLWLEHKWRNRLHTAALLLGLGLLLAVLGWLLGGHVGAVLVLMLGSFILAFGPRVSPKLILKMNRAQQLSPYQAADIYQAMAILTKKAQLQHVPQLYLIPSQNLNAFALSLGKSRPAILVTDGLLARLSIRELVGVLAHEISHLRNRDTQVMHLGAVINQLVGSFAGLARFLLCFNFALILLTGASLNWLPLLLMALAPIPSTLFQLALARTREFDADLGAAALTGDPQGLASALRKLDKLEYGFLQRLFLPQRDQANWLRTHPPSHERIRRLQALARNDPNGQGQATAYYDRDFRIPHSHYPYYRNFLR